MQILVNGNSERIERTMTVRDFLQHKMIDSTLLVIEWNFRALSPAEWDTVYLEDGDNLEIIRVAGGG